MSRTSQPSNRRKRRQAQRRVKRDVMQNHMVLRGWVPVKVGSHGHGLMNLSEQRVVYRGFNAVVHSGVNNGSVTLIKRGWSYVATHIGAQNSNLVECSWNDLQAQWVRNMRSLLIQRGWV